MIKISREVIISLIVEQMIMIREIIDIFNKKNIITLTFKY